MNVLEELRKSLHIDDPFFIDVAAASVLANLAQEDEPIWLLYVNPPSTGKTEITRLFEKVQGCAWLPEVTENTFLSGLVQNNQLVREASLLYRWTDPVILKGKPPVCVALIQDLTGLITKHATKREAIFGQLRQIYDGHCNKTTGFGFDMEWIGYMGLLGAVTPIIEEVSEIHSALGERFILYRPNRVDVFKEGLATLSRNGTQNWRAPIQDYLATFLYERIPTYKRVEISLADHPRLVKLAHIVAIGRTKVSRDKSSRDIDGGLYPEGPSRLTRQFHKLIKGLCALSNVLEPEPRHWEVLAKISGDSLPAARLQLMQLLNQGPIEPKDLQEKVSCGSSTLYRRLQDLYALNMASAKNGQWMLTPHYAQYCYDTGVLIKQEIIHGS